MTKKIPETHYIPWDEADIISEDPGRHVRYFKGLVKSLNSMYFNVSNAINNIISRMQGNVYYPDYAETDQGVLGRGLSMKAYIDLIGTARAIIVLQHNSGEDETPYTLATNEDVPLNISFQIEDGAVIDGAGTLTIASLFKHGRNKCFGSTITVSGLTKAFPEWWGDNTTPGTTDMTVEINTAIDAIELTGHGDISFEAYDYLISAALTSDHNNIGIIGKGREKTRIITNSITADVFTFGSGGASRTSIEIKDLSIWTFAAKTAGSGIHLNHVSMVHISNIYMVSMFRGIQIANGGVLHFMNNIDIRELVTDIGIGIEIDAGNDQYISKVIVGGTTHYKYGIRVHKTGGLWLSDCDIMQAKVGLLIAPGVGQIVNWAFISQCAFDTCDEYGIQLYGSTATSIIKGIFFTNSWTATNVLSGVYIQGVAGSVIDGIEFNAHRSLNNVQHGFIIGSVPINWAIQNSIIAGNSETIPDIYSGVFIGTDASKFTITDNKIGQATAMPNSQRWGIIIAAGASDEYIITGNRLTDNMTGSLSDGGTGTNKTIKDNLPNIETVTTAAPALLIWGASEIDSTDNVVAATLGDGGFLGQTKLIVMTVAANNSTVTVAHHESGNNTVYTFSAVDHAVKLEWTGTEWVEIGVFGGLASAVPPITMGELTDVVITGPADLDLIQYDNATSMWVDRTFAEAGISAVGHTHVEANITDLDRYTQAAVDALLAAQDAISELVDVTITAIADKEILQWNNATSKWINRTLAEAGIANTSHAGTHVTGGSDVIANAIAAGNAGLMTGADKTKLNGIEGSATIDQTGIEIVALLEALVGVAKLSHDTGLSDISSDDHHAQLHAVQHVTGGGDVIANAIAAGNAGLMTGADKTKLDGIEALADVTDFTNVNAALLAATASVRIGAQDANVNVVTISGAATGSNEGGEFRLDMAADHDAAFDYWRIDVSQTTLRIGPTGVGGVKIATNLDMTIPSLAGAGSRTVVADANGKLSAP